MFSKSLFRTLIGCFFTVLLSVLMAGCGGGSNDTNGTTLSAPGALNARVGPVVAVRVGEIAILDGSKSTNPSTSPLGYAWSFASKPDKSNAVLQNPDSTSPGFVADVRGAYMVQLVVSVDGLSSQRAIQLIIATIDPERPTGPFDHRGLSSSCVNCHNGEIALDSRPGKIPGKSAGHLATGNVCETCHTPMGFALSSPSLDASGIPVTLPGGLAVGPFTVSVDHDEVFGNCSNCHDGLLTIGKSDFHIETSAECDNCHGTNSFFDLALDGTFDHSGISGGCSGCHDGVVAIGTTDTSIHQNTQSDCIFCHLPFSPPNVVDFSGGRPDHNSPDVLAVRCDSCHGNGPSAIAQGEPGGHPVMAVDCDSCHNVLIFSLGGVFDHRIDPAVQNCETCHAEPNSINAPGISAGHPATGGADCGVCHNTDSFAGAFDHTAITNNCQTCHGNNSPIPPQVTATGKPAPTDLYAHMPTNPDNPGLVTDEDCGNCHTPGTFKTGTYDHAGLVSGCNSCHDSRVSVGKLASHFPTIPDTQDCADCHYNAALVPAIFFAGATFDHAGIAGNNCASCHNGIYVTTTGTLFGKPSTHIPTNQDCNVCHTVGVPFKPDSNFNHVEITDQCETCHNGNPDFVAVGALGKKLNHIPASNECILCHLKTSTSPGGFASTTTFLANVHNTITQGCSGCHTDLFFPTPVTSALVKTATHLPTTQDCDTCHTVVGFKPSTFAHAGITGQCASCHDGSTNFVAVGALGKTPTHPLTDGDCGLCHNTSNFAEVFDHTGRTDNCSECHGDGATGAVTKKNPGHVPTSDDCSLCHVPGSFATAVFNHTGIVNNCASCHDGVSATGMDAKTNPPHIPTTQDCSVCHQPTAFAQANFSHQDIVDNCGICHNGTTASGKQSSHVPTGEDCVACHQTTGFLPATFSHAGIVDNCSSCHAAGLATPKTFNHVATSQDCGVCHNTTAFIPATFDHTGIIDNCGFCHGVTATPRPVDHLPTSLDCASCHTTATFVGGVWVHDAGASGNCDTCHSSGGGATPKLTGHLSTSEQCDVCHSTNGWVPTNFSHNPAGNYPGDHRLNLSCGSCHKGAIGAGINSDNYPDQLIYAPFCAGCHAGDFESEGDHNGGSSGTIAQNMDCSGGGSGCHRVNDSGF